MHGSYASNGSYGANGIRWRPMKMEITEMDIGNHRARITRLTPIARLTPKFFCPMVADENPSLACPWSTDRLSGVVFIHGGCQLVGLH